MAHADTSALLRSKVLFVTGKGGTGKTSLAAAVARLSAAQGRRVLLAELDSQRPSLTGIFGLTPGYTPVSVAAGLDIVNVEWMPALEDWLGDIIGMPRVVRLVMHNRVVHLFLEATPGARDLMVLTRVVRFSERYEQVIVDMPASGNAVAMLSVAGTAQRLFDTGPVRRCADELAALLHAPTTSMVLVAIPEEMVVNETVETTRKLGVEVPGLRLPLVVLNRATSPSFSASEEALLERLAAGGETGLAREVVEAGLWERELERATTLAFERFAAELEVPVLSVPVLARGEGAGKVVAQLSAAVARASRERVEFVGEAS